MGRVSPQLIVFSYHKTGTSLLFHVMTKVSERLGLSMVNHYGLVDRIDPEPDVVLLPHSLSRAPLDRPYRAIRMIRDPRDIWVSGYLYHRHCVEEWCTNTDLDPTPPILWPKVDHSIAHWPEDRKRRYLERLDGKSYQLGLLDRSPAEGLDFELEGYTAHTLTAMRQWPLNGAVALDVKLEDAMADFDGTMRRIFGHFGFTAEQTEAAQEAARSEDVQRMDEATVARRPQIHSRTISKWRDILSDAQVARFEADHGDLIRELGYETAGPAPSFTAIADPDDWLAQTGAALSIEVDPVRLLWPRLADTPEEAGHGPAVAIATQDADVRLVADGAMIRPTVSGDGAFSFVVPSGAERVWLRSRRGVPGDPRAPYLGNGRCLGVKVSKIDIRSRAGDVVIPADDPRLIVGWHEAEHAGLGLWRWTDGSAELPWSGVSGPAVVTIHCTALADYADHHAAGRMTMVDVDHAGE